MSTDARLNPDGYAPIPGRTMTVAVPNDLRTAVVNNLLRNTTNSVLAAQVKMAAPYSLLRGATANHDRVARRGYAGRIVPAHYNHGFGTTFRATATARYTPTLREVDVYFPPNYRGMDHPNTDDWLTTRVYIYDSLLFALAREGGEIVTIA